MFLQRFEQCVLSQRFTTLGAERVKVRCARITNLEMRLAKMLICEFERASFELGYADVVNQLSSAHLGESLFELRRLDQRSSLLRLAKILDRFDVQIQNIEEQSAGRAVRACMRRIVRKQGVQRIDRGERGTAADPVVGQIG